MCFSLNTKKYLLKPWLQPLAKGQLISKANCQAVDSPKQWTNEFAFFDLKSCYVVKSNAVFLENLIFHKKWSHAFEINWPLHSRIWSVAILATKSSNEILQIIVFYHCYILDMILQVLQWNHRNVKDVIETKFLKDFCSSL